MPFAVCCRTIRDRWNKCPQLSDSHLANADQKTYDHNSCHNTFITLFISDSAFLYQLMQDFLGFV